MPPTATADWRLAAFIIAGTFFMCLLALAAILFAAWLKDRHASRTRLAALPPLAPEQLDAGVERLRAALRIPAQRGAGERRAG